MRCLFICLSVVFIGYVCAEEKNSSDNLLPALHDLPLNRPVQRLAGCRDMFLSCPRWAELGACESRRYTLGQKRAYCRKTCNLCDSPDNNDSGDNNNGGDDTPAKNDTPAKTPLEAIVDALKDFAKAN